MSFLLYSGVEKMSLRSTGRPWNLAGDESDSANENSGPNAALLQLKSWVI